MSKIQTKLVMLILVICIVALYFQNISSKKERVYRLNTDCVERATNFKKQENEKSLTTWEVIKTVFNEKENSCFGEFTFGNMYLIYDLTHSTIVIQQTYNTKNEYLIVRKKIFSDIKEVW